MRFKEQWLSSPVARWLHSWETRHEEVYAGGAWGAVEARRGSWRDGAAASHTCSGFRYDSRLNTLVYTSLDARRLFLTLLRGRAHLQASVRFVMHVFCSPTNLTLFSYQPLQCWRPRRVPASRATSLQACAPQPPASTRPETLWANPPASLTRGRPQHSQHTPLHSTVLHLR